MFTFFIQELFPLHVASYCVIAVQKIIHFSKFNFYAAAQAALIIWSSNIHLMLLLKRGHNTLSPYASSVLLSSVDHWHQNMEYGGALHPFKSSKVNKIWIFPNETPVKNLETKTYSPICTWMHLPAFSILYGINSIILSSYGTIALIQKHGYNYLFWPLV